MHAKSLDLNGAGQTAGNVASSSIHVGPEDVFKNEADKAPLETSRKTDASDGTEGGSPDA